MCIACAHDTILTNAVKAIGETYLTRIRNLFVLVQASYDSGACTLQEGLVAGTAALSASGIDKLFGYTGAASHPVPAADTVRSGVISECGDAAARLNAHCHTRALSHTHTHAHACTHTHPHTA